uniref:Apple domain-containing protein n=1 Tax=Ditylenchus dipsaci TaxID=166011 RepID=A0A915E4K6_9BILA
MDCYNKRCSSSSTSSSNAAAPWSAKQGMNVNPNLLSTLAMWTSLCIMLLGLASCCVFAALPQIQYVNDKPYHLMQSTECKGGKVYEINQVQDIDECKTACLHRNCRAVNLFQVGEFEFKCEILAYVRGYNPAQGAACYISYY